MFRSSQETVGTKSENEFNDFAQFHSGKFPPPCAGNGSNHLPALVQFRSIDREIETLNKRERSLPEDSAADPSAEDSVNPARRIRHRFQFAHESDQSSTLLVHSATV